jgi:hypothetical protein
MIHGINIKKSDDYYISVKPPLSRYQELLLLCFYSGQIEPSAWEQHLHEDPALAAYFKFPFHADRMN